MKFDGFKEVFAWTKEAYLFGRGEHVTGRREREWFSFPFIWRTNLN